MAQINGRKIGTTGYGLMGFTWRPKTAPQKQAFEAMKESLKHGANFWNGGEIYGSPERNSLHLLNEYFTQYPEDAKDIVLSIKGGIKLPTMQPDGSRESIRRSIDECLKVLDGKKFLDIFECARVDINTPIEETIGYIAEYVKEGKIGGIGLSEASAETIRKAHSAHPISAVEVELSLWSLDILENGVASTCAELGIPIIAYSPLGRGFLTGQIKGPEDVERVNPRLLGMDRFQPENFDNNLKLVREVEAIAKKKGCTPAQVAIAWIKTQSGKNGMPVIIPIPGATTKERVAENMSDVELEEADMKEISNILANFTVAGSRYNKHGNVHLNR